jgi:ATP phosphoribosyltransferase
MLKIAVPNKGSLSESATLMLREAGYRQRSDVRDLVLIDPDNDIEFYYLRPRDIAIYVGSGELELGITGRDLLLDSGVSAQEVLALDFGRSTFRFAAPAGKSLLETDLKGLRVATAYPGLLERYLSDKGINATVVRLDGAVESAIRLGVADVIADVVSTGGTVRLWRRVARICVRSQPRAILMMGISSSLYIARNSVGSVRSHFVTMMIGAIP